MSSSYERRGDVAAQWIRAAEDYFLIHCEDDESWAETTPIGVISWQRLISRGLWFLCLNGVPARNLSVPSREEFIAECRGLARFRDIGLLPAEKAEALGSGVTPQGPSPLRAFIGVDL